MCVLFVVYYVDFFFEDVVFDFGIGMGVIVFVFVFDVKCVVGCDISEGMFE